MPRRDTAARAPWRRLRAGIGELNRTFPTGDLALWAAGATFFGVIGLVPVAMVALRVAAAVAGPERVAALMDVAISGLPPGHGTPQALRTLTTTSVGLSWPRTAVVLVPASLYGEGLRRAFRQLTPGARERLIGWRGRLGLLPAVAVAPLLLLGLLVSAPTVAPMITGEHPFKGIVAAFHVTFVLVSVVLALLYGVVAPGRVRPGALLLGALGTGAVLAGFLMGFLLFLAIPVEWSLPFGGLPVVGAVSALGLWLYLIHVLVLVGYRATLVLDERLRPADRPRR